MNALSPASVTTTAPYHPHPSECPLVIAARAEAYVPFCAVAPKIDRLATELDDLFGDADCIDGMDAVMAPVLRNLGPSDLLSDLVSTAKKECGDEPYYDERGGGIDYVVGGYKEIGDGAAWERWKDDVDAAQADAERQFRVEMAGLLRQVARVARGSV